MPEAPTPGRTKIAAAAGLIGATAIASLVLGLGPAPSVLQLAGASDDTTDDVSGPCDEAEHANDPQCGGTATAPDDGDDGSTSTTVGGTSSTTAGDSAGTADEIHSLDAAGAGTVIYAVEGSSLRLVTATPASGWAVEVEQASGREIELDFRSGTRRVQVNVEMEDGEVRERVRFRDDADDTDIRTEDGVVQQDSSGPGSGSDDAVDDNSGPGSDDSGHDSTDDSSGSGSGSDDSSGHSGDDSSGRDHPEDD